MTPVMRLIRLITPFVPVPPPRYERRLVFGVIVLTVVQIALTISQIGH